MLRPPALLPGGTMREEPEVVTAGAGVLTRWLRRIEPLELMDIFIILAAGLILLMLF